MKTKEKNQQLQENIDDILNQYGISKTQEHLEAINTEMKKRVLLNNAAPKNYLMFAYQKLFGERSGIFLKITDPDCFCRNMGLIDEFPDWVYDFVELRINLLTRKISFELIPFEDFHNLLRENIKGETSLFEHTLHTLDPKKYEFKKKFNVTFAVEQIADNFLYMLDKWQRELVKKEGFNVLRGVIDKQIQESYQLFQDEMKQIRDQGVDGNEQIPNVFE